MEKLEPNFNPDRGRMGFLKKLGEKINRRGKKGETCSFRSFQQRVTIFDGQTSSTTTSPFIPRVSPGYGGERIEEGRSGGGWAGASKPGTKQITGPMGINIS